MTTVTDALRSVPWWYWVGGLYYLVGYLLHDLLEVNSFTSVCDQIKAAIYNLFYGTLILGITLIALVIHLLLWPVLVVIRSALQVYKRNTRDISHRIIYRQSPYEFYKEWMGVPNQRRFVWQKGRWHVMGRWLPAPEYELFDFVKADRSVLNGPSLVLHLIVVSIGITRLPPTGESLKEFS